MKEEYAILKMLGCKKLYDIEKIRETWEVGGCKEVVFDAYPGLLTYMEIDCHTVP
jgi:adenylate cyclase class IV